MPVTAFQEMSVTGKVTGRDVENARNDLKRRETCFQANLLIFRCFLAVLKRPETTKNKAVVEPGGVGLMFTVVHGCKK